MQYDLNQNLSSCFVDISKFIWKTNKKKNSQHNTKKNKVEGLQLPNFKTYSKATVINIAWFLCILLLLGEVFYKCQLGLVD